MTVVQAVNSPWKSRSTKTMIHPNKTIRPRGINSSQSRNVFILRRRRGMESRKGAR